MSIVSRTLTIYITENPYGILPGYYTMNEIVELFRRYCEESNVVYFLADMLEQ